MKIRILLAVLACFAPTLAARATVGADTATAPPALSARDQKQAAGEMKQGAEASAEVNKHVKLVTDKATLDRVNGIGQRIAAIANTTQFRANYGNDRVYPFIWHFFVIEDKDVNAFSLPGGYVYVNSGLLKAVRSDDELAGVLAHEITHAAHHHIQSLSHESSKMTTEMLAGLLVAVLAHVPAQDISNLANGVGLAQQGILNTRYSQAAERDADHGGTILMQKAGFNPVGMLTFMRMLKQLGDRGPQVELGILQDHPFTSERVGYLGDQLKEMHVEITPRAVRAVTDAARATVHPDPVAGRDIVFAGHTLPALSDPDGDRTQAIVTRFNAQLDAGLDLYQIGASGNEVLLSDRALITVTPADQALHSGQSPETLARTAADALRGGYYAQTFTRSIP
jgi:predicted Zn-dependent protease